MAKTGGLGQALYVAGVDLSGDTGSLDRSGGGPNLLVVTGIDKSAIERIGGKRDGEISFNPWFNPSAGQAHLLLRGLPTADVHVMHVMQQSVGGAFAAAVAKQVNYDGAVAGDGSFPLKVQALANAFGLEMGGSGPPTFNEDGMLTAGKRVDTAPTNGTSIDFGSVNTAFGMSAYLQVLAFTGTNVVIRVEDSADNSSFAAVTGLTFTTITAAPGYERLQTATGATIRRYLRVVTSSGTFSSVTFAVAVIRHKTATL